MPDRADESDLAIFGSLRQRRLPDGLFIGDGLKIVRRILESALCVERVLLTQKWYDLLGELLGRRPEPELRVRVATQEQVDAIVGFKLHQGVMALARIPPPPPLDDVLASKAAPVLAALDGLSNAENVGAIVRSCAAFGIDGILVGPATCSPWMRRAVRASMGGVLRVAIWETGDLAGTLRRHPSLKSYAAHIHGEHQAISQVDFTGPTCVVLGGEARGVSAPVLAACRATVYIPMSDDWECLNVGAAAAVLLYEATRSRGR
ncbi:MAG: RNA methyltransferase [Planctomycetes bacterium]|nr:RNA methyltransferase [Planctomycetota bacterium]